MFEKFSKEIETIKEHIKSYQDFPIKGVLFRDVFSVLAEPKVFSLLKKILSEYIQDLSENIDCVVALDSRGFLIGPLLALEINVPFVPIRKKGKLPGELQSVAFDLEYGKEVFEIQKDSIKKGDKVIIVDDLLATGGSLNAACKLVEGCGGIIQHCLVIIELLELKGRKNVPVEIHSMIQF